MSNPPEEATEVELRMDAYYYSFEPTGVLEIDKILSAVATAGKGYHHTEDWNEKLSDGTTYVEGIQQAANEAATILHERSKKVEAASVEREMLKRFAEFVIDDVVKFVDGVITYYPHAIEKLVGDFLEQERAKK